MHPNPSFRRASLRDNLDFARERGFGQLTICAEDGPIAAHVPFVFLNDDALELHLARSNPIARLIQKGGPVQALLAATGVDAYISPDWYRVDDQVPTWNYIAVHLRGELSHEPDLRSHLDRVSHEFERRLAPKPEWLTTKMSEDVLAKMMRAITAFRLDLASVDGTWKLSQNKTDEVRLAAADHVAPEMAALMRGL